MVTEAARGTNHAFGGPVIFVSFVSFMVETQ